MGRGKSAAKKKAKRLREKNQANLVRMKELGVQLKEREALKKLMLDKKVPDKI